MKLFKKVMLGTMSLLTIGVLVSCGDKEKTNTPQEHEHIVVVDQAISATCETPGLTEGSHCSECGEIFVKQNVIPALGHDGMVCSRCGQGDISEEFFNNMISSIDYNNGVLLSIPDCQMKVTLENGKENESLILIPEIYLDLSSSIELYGKFSTIDKDVELDSIDKLEVQFKVVDELLILDIHNNELSFEGVELYDDITYRVLPFSYLEEKMNDLYVTLTNVMNNINTIKDSYLNLASNFNSNVSIDLINTIFDAKKDGEKYIIFNNNELLGTTIKQAIDYLNNNSVEDVINDYVKGIIGDLAYNKYFTNGAFNTIFNSDTISTNYDLVQTTLEGITVEEFVLYVETILEEKMGVETSAETPYQAILSLASLADAMLSQYVIETNGEILTTVSNFVQNIPNMTLYDAILQYSNNLLSKDSVLSYVDIINSIKDKSVMEIVLSSAGIELSPELFNAYLTIVVSEINKLYDKFDLVIVTDKTGVIENINMDIDCLVFNNKSYKSSIKVSFGKYSSKLDYSNFQKIFTDYNGYINLLDKESIEQYESTEYEIVSISDDAKTISLLNLETNEISQYVFSNALEVEYSGDCYRISFSYKSNDEEVLISYSFGEDNLCYVYIMRDSFI